MINDVEYLEQKHIMEHKSIGTGYLYNYPSTQLYIFFNLIINVAYSFFHKINMVGPLFSLIVD